MFEKFILLIAVSLLAFDSTADAQDLYDNGPFDGVNGFSQGDVNSVGQDRFLLDDLVVAPTAGDSWEVTGFTLQHVWGTAPSGLGPATGLTLEIFNDSAGTPDVASGVVSTATATMYTETNLTFTQGVVPQFSRDVWESTVDTEPFTICPGTYWFRARLEGALENNFWLTAAINGNESWSEYGGVLFPSGDPDGPFGAASDLTWSVQGSESTTGACSGRTCADPTDFIQFRGSPIGAPATGDFAGPDGVFASYNPGFTLANVEDPVWLIFDYAAGSSGGVEVTSKAGTPGLIMRAQYWNGNSYISIGAIEETFGSFSTVFFSFGGVSADRVRIGWRKAGFTINFPWQVDVDSVALCQ